MAAWYRPLAIAIRQPAPTAIRAASSLVRIPPEPWLEPGPPAMSQCSRLSSVTSSICRAVAVDARVGRVEPVDVRQQHETFGADHLRDARGKPIVVAVAQLLRRDGVVLVHDGHRAVTEQREQRLARVQVTFAGSRCRRS